MPFDYNKVKDILACPRCHAELVLDDAALVSVNPEFRLSYPIVDDIPRLLEEEALELSPENWAEVMQRHGRDAKSGLPVSSTSLPE
ncbi:MAG: hypothetical protein R3C59_12615 [Planctomycetaceae bacterium]